MVVARSPGGVGVQEKTPGPVNALFQPHTSFFVGVPAVVTHHLKGLFGYMLRDGGDELSGCVYPEVLPVPAVGKGRKRSKND